MEEYQERARMSLFCSDRCSFRAKTLIYGDDECWEWRSGRHWKGYGMMTTVSGKVMYAHRISWNLHRGEIPGKLMVLHHCDNPGCVNPKHLFLGTGKDNADDMDKKGRRVISRGEKNGNSIHTEEFIKAVRAARENEGLGYKRLAKRFGLIPSYVRSIVLRHVWKHI